MKSLLTYGKIHKAHKCIYIHVRLFTILQNKMCSHHEVKDHPVYTDPQFSTIHHKFSRNKEGNNLNNNNTNNTFNTTIQSRDRVGRRPDHLFYYN